jgi:hypothetical protein
MFIREPRKGALRAGLIQASLDAEIRPIDPVATAHVASVPVELDVAVLHRDDGRFYLDIVPARRLRDLEDEGLLQIGVRDLGLAPFVDTTEE